MTRSSRSVSRRSVLAFGTLASALVAAGCGTSVGASVADPARLGPEADRMADLYRRALAARENPVVVYGAAQEYYARAWNVFQNRFPGVPIRYQSIFGAPLAARLDQEFLSGARIGCIQLAAALPTAGTVRTKRAQPITPFTAGYLPPEAYGKDNAFVRFGYWPHGIEYNRSLVSDAEAPRSWADLVRPEWANRLTIQNPTTNNGTSNGIALLLARELISEAWIKDLAAQKPLIQSSVSLAEQVVARGERAVMVTNYAPPYVSLRDKGVNLGYVFPPDEGARLEPQYVTMLAKNPAPLSSELLVNWLFTPEGQEAMSSVGNYAVDPETTPPPTLPPMPEAIPELPVAEIAAQSAKTVEIIRKYFV